MAQIDPASPPSTDLADVAGGLHVVLFGIPDAGKSSLLGALGQAAHTQEHLLNGRLVDRSQGLEELRHRLYEGKARRTAEEVVPYPVGFEPFGDKGQPGGHEPVAAVILDCDGRVANDLLVQRQSLTEDRPEGTLAHAIYRADALVLVIDASAPPAHLDADFAEFDRFLRHMERGRSMRTEVGGLPVFLVLTKCDLLAQPGDGPASWMERIEDRKREVDRRFRDFLDRRKQESGPLPFGHIELHLWATAVRQPALGGSPAREREPFGVAELFRQALEQAAAFHARRRQAARRLLWTVIASTATLLLLLGLAVAFFVRNYSLRSSDLQERVALVRLSDQPTPSERLHASRVQLLRREDELRKIRGDAHFDDLPADDQQLVRSRLDELQGYLEYLDKVRQSSRPADAHNEKDLERIRRELQTTLVPPVDGWGDTEADRLRKERIQDAEALGRAARRARDWYLGDSEKTDALWTFKEYVSDTPLAGISWQKWVRDAERQLAPGHALPYAEGEVIPGSPGGLTYAAVLHFEEVVQARSEWEAERRRLDRLLNLTAALGMAGTVKDRPPALVIPTSFTLEQARQRRQQLQRAYPRFQEEFTLDQLPEALVPQVRQAAGTSYENLLEPGQKAVLAQLRQAGSGTEESAARWEEVRKWLGSPTELSDWRVLAAVLARLHDPDAKDPVTALREFLEKSSFPVDVQRLTLEIPESVQARAAQGAKLTIHHETRSGKQPSVVLELAEEGERDARRRVWVYRFRRIEGERFSYHPGDDLWATLPLRDDWQLTWARNRSMQYQFERLLRPPRLHKSNEPNTAGTLEEGIRVRITPPDGLPGLPDLMPVVRLEPER
jgi:hypothetical protein